MRFLLDMNAKGYSVYKDSTIEWLGEVPEHWQVKKFNYIAQIAEGQIDPKKEPYKNYVLVAPNHIESGTGRLLYKETAFEQGAESGKYLFLANDIIYSKIRPALKKVWKADFPGICSADMYPIRLSKEKIEPNYFTFLCLSESFSNFMIATSMRVAMPKVNRDDFHECHFAIPPISEQKSIALYLDTKTAQIDRKIDLLTQKATGYGNLKRSLINETVTRGLDRSVPMKDSGIDTIGEVPEHWKVKRFKEIFRKTHSGWTPDTSNQENFEGLNVWVTIRDMNETYINDSLSKLSDKAVRESQISLTPKGSLLFSFKLSIGKIAFAGCDLYTNEAIISIEIEKTLSLNYFYYALPILLILNAKENIYGAKLLNQSLIFNTSLLFPPLSEQKTIADYLDTKTAQIDQIIQTINTQIEKLKELRKTLINDVVTGKIRVTEPIETHLSD